MLGGLGAVVAGLIMTRGRMLGGGHEKIHHLFVWPAVITCAVFVGWRLLRRGRIPQRGLGVYFAGMGIVSALMIGAGYSGGEMLLAAGSADDPAPSALGVPALAGARPTEGGTPSRSASDQSVRIAAGQQLFLKNCAHCHGADARGDEGPDLHGLRKSDTRITKIIKEGIKGEMPAFGKKLSDSDVEALISFLRTLPE